MNKAVMRKFIDNFKSKEDKTTKSYAEERALEFTKGIALPAGPMKYFTDGYLDAVEQTGVEKTESENQEFRDIINEHNIAIQSMKDLVKEKDREIEKLRSMLKKLDNSMRQKDADLKEMAEALKESKTHFNILINSIIEEHPKYKVGAEETKLVFNNRVEKVLSKQEGR